MEFLIISGLSGSGKSRAAAVLEDMGYYIVDNLPAVMMAKFADFCCAMGNRYDRVAMVYDIRANEPPEKLPEALAAIRRAGGCRLLFLESDTKTLISRYKETRRTHPLAALADSMEDAIARERQILAPIRRQADIVLDTSGYSVAKLRSAVIELFGGAGDQQGMSVVIASFGYKYGIPQEADLVFDVRFLPNPYYVPELKEKNGTDKAVRDYVFAGPEAEKFADKLEELLGFLLPCYRREGKSVLVIGIGCTGGRHRSVAVAEELFRRLQGMGCPVTLSHRDMAR